MPEMNQDKPDFRHECRLSRQYKGAVAGVDEAGRGPWAGPVLAAAVILDPDHVPAGLNDSKKLSAKRREQLYEQIRTMAQVGIGLADVATIDRINILNATLHAMAQAIDNLPTSPAVVLIDGNRPPELPCPALTLVKGDQLSLSIAAASIIAKVERDRLMAALASDYPHYGFEKHKGYGTKAHRDALTLHGVTRHHRRSFKPIAQLLETTDK